MKRSKLSTSVQAVVATRLAAMHDNLFVRNVSFAIRKRTFAATSLNARFGSIPVYEVTGFDAGRLLDLAIS
ncbi:MAG: hypothetical protein V3R80_12800 [Candidatus Tectomicrobia bacterium]